MFSIVMCAIWGAIHSVMAAKLNIPFSDPMYWITFFFGFNVVYFATYRR